MSDLGEFLLARIYDDEQAAREAGAEPWQVIASDVHLTGENANFCVATGPYGGAIGRAAIHMVRHQPLSVLAECKAKRQIVEDYLDADREVAEGEKDYIARRNVLFSVLSTLALPYAGHRDYRQEWSPLAAL